MDPTKYSSLMASLTALPDPRKARGKQLEWHFIWGVIVTAMLHNQRSATAIAHWASRQAHSLVAAFQPTKQRVPSEATIRRALRLVDVDALERVIAHASLPSSAPSEPLRGYAIDGKYVRGAGAHGHSTLLVSLVEHASAEVLAQTAVEGKQHESKAVPILLHQRNLEGCIITLDAGLTHPKIARQIREQGGHFFMVVKRNHRQLYDELTWFFSRPPLPCERPWQTITTVNKGHGRLETRTITVTDDLDDYLEWRDVCVVLRRESERIEVKTGEVTRSVSYAMTSARLSARQAAEVWRGHWSIENRRHYVRDVTMGEDGCQMHVGHAPQALAAVRNGLISLMRRAGWTNIAAGLRHYSTSLPDALHLIGVPTFRL